MPAIKINILCFSLAALFSVCLSSPFTISRQTSNIELEQNSNTCTEPMVVDNETIQLGNCDGMYYTLPLSIGTPSQQFNAIISTASSQVILQAST
jgi:hypothetical protein